MSRDKGAPAIDARVVIGAMIIKHKLKLDYRETIETIRENINMQYFLGLEGYTYNDVFDYSVFTTLRYRLEVDKFDAMTRQIILTSEGKHEAAQKDLVEMINNNLGFLANSNDGILAISDVVFLANKNVGF